MINRKKIIESFSPIIYEINNNSPFTIGNGSFGFTADVTGLQTLYPYYDTDGGFPLCSLSQWGWNRHYFKDKTYPSRQDLNYTTYETPIDHRIIKYPVEAAEGNEDIYEWFRKNPHRCNLYRIGFLHDNSPINKSDVKVIYQKMDIYQGILISNFQIKNKDVYVETFVSAFDDSLNVKVNSEIDLQICIQFPYSNWTKNASDWNHPDLHKTIMKVGKNRIDFERQLNDFNYYTTLYYKKNMPIKFDSTKHRLIASLSRNCEFSLLVSEKETKHLMSIEAAREKTTKYWGTFWNSTGFVSVLDSKDDRAEELQRRIILSKYLLQIQSNTATPPQETGLSCNSWYGKSHLEMHLWHTGYLPCWGQQDDLKRTLIWYRNHLPEAKANAAFNGYLGARWPKMIGNDFLDSPSKIAPLLIWQQTHVIYLMDQIYRTDLDISFIQENYDLLVNTIEFVISFLIYDPSRGKYVIQPPVMPSQEVFEATKVYNPTFEIEYWRFALAIAIDWSNKIGKNENASEWEIVFQNLTALDEQFPFYPAYEGEENTFKKYNHDHPSFVGVYGLINHSTMKTDKVNDTLSKVLKEWVYDELWGWDYAMLAMTATKLGRPKDAVDILLSDTPKNQYLVNGNNYQKLTNDPKNYLPVYLPGNGSLLLAVALMASNDCWGFPKEAWKVEVEDMNEWPYL